MDNSLPEGTYVFVWGGLIKNAGGMTRAMLKRADMFIGKNVKVKILLSARGIEQLDGVEHYRENGYKNIDETMFVVMEKFLGNRLSDMEKRHEIANRFRRLEELPYKINGNRKKYYNEGKIYAIENIQESKRKRIIEYYKNDVKEFEEIIWDDRLSRIQEYKEKGGTKYKQTRFFAENGFCFMCIEEKKKETEIWEVRSIKLFSEKDLNVAEYKSLDELRKLFFVTWVKECPDREVFVFCDPILDFDPGFEDMVMEGKNIYRIAINHGIGIGGERQWYSQLNPRIRDNIEKRITPNMEGLILLTKEALEDFSKRLGGRNILYNIPNTVHIPKCISDFGKRDLTKVVYIGRFDEKVKQITHAIRAWKKVEKAVPEAELHIYGRGNDEDVLRQCIREHSLKKVFIESFENNVNKVYQEAAFALSCSASEGFSLVLLEALANGCPIVTYDFKYGPKDAVENGKNGLVIEKNNIDAFADGIIWMLLHPEEICSMSMEARKRILRYHDSFYLDNWANVLNTVKKRYDYNTWIDEVIFQLTEYRVKKSICRIELEGRLQIKGKIPENAIGMERIYLRRYSSDRKEFVVSDVDIRCIDIYNYEIHTVIPYDGNVISICIEYCNSFAERVVEL